MTHLAVVIMVHNLDQALAESARAAEQGADLVEFRIDRFTDDRDAVRQLVEQASLPCILTCRPRWEGGDYDGDDQARISLLEYVGLGVCQPTYMDVELATYQRSANLRQKIGLVIDHPNQLRPTQTGLILSSHDFDSRPIDLHQRIEAMTAAVACRVIKVVWMARSLQDNLEAFEILMQHHKPTISLCMGEAGLASRVLAKKFGALLTFASLESDSGTAAGQITVKQLKSLYRWDVLDVETRVYGVIGHPISHSKGPAIHNGGFDTTGHNGVYLPMPIAPGYEPFKAIVSSWLAMAGLHFHGASVTLPHKQNLLRFVRESGGEVEPLAERIGAANTLTVREDGSIYASNTDYAAALEAVCTTLDCNRDDLKGQRVAVIGAGGVARAVVAGFAQHGANITIYNRTPENATALTASLEDIAGKVTTARLEDLRNANCQIYINCTPLGMYPHPDASPINGNKPTNGWGPGTIVFDTIYNPVDTRLLRQARDDGCVTISGIEMFVRQAAAQFRQWTQQDAPLDVFRRIMGTTDNTD